MSETHTLSERYGLREITPASLVAQAKRILGPERDPIMKPGDDYTLPRDDPPSWPAVNALCRDVIDLFGKGAPITSETPDPIPNERLISLGDGDYRFVPYRQGEVNAVSFPGAWVKVKPLKTGVGE